MGSNKNVKRRLFEDAEPSTSANVKRSKFNSN